LITVKSLHHIDHINTSSLHHFIINLHHQLTHNIIKSSTHVKIIILGSFLTPRKTTLFWPFFDLINFHHSTHHWSSSSTSSTHRQRPQKHVFFSFLTFLKTENFFSKVQIKYPLIRLNYFGGPVLGVQATGSGEVMPIWGRSSWITVPNHTILSARRPKLEVPTRRFSWPSGPSALRPPKAKTVIFDASMMMLNVVQRVVVSCFSLTKRVF
jgi:hypothetical protein